MESLRLRLPLLFSALVAIFLTVFLFIANHEFERMLLQDGEERVQTAATRVAEVVGSNVTRAEVEAELTAEEEVIRAALRDPTPARLERARQRLARLAASSQFPVELWDAQGKLALAIATNGSDLQSAAGPQPPGQLSGVGPLRNDGGRPAYDVTIASRVPDAGQDNAPEDPMLGTLVLRRALANTRTADTIRQLVGGAALGLIGNQTGDLWSDFSNIVTGPPIDASGSGLMHYVDRDGERKIGAMAPVPQTPWAVWIELPRASLLAPARAALTRMIAIGAAFILIAALIVWLVSRHITTPLHELTVASESLAAGHYADRVKVSRTDEIGRLGVAFNVRAGRVDEAHQALEEQVEQRTEHLRAAVEELDAFSYSVSHDLRAPLRHISGFASLLEDSSGSTLTDAGRRHLDTIRKAAERMGRLIDDLLLFSRVSRAPLRKEPLDLRAIVEDARAEVMTGRTGGNTRWRVAPLPSVKGDPSLIRQVFVNLIGNAVKYSADRKPPEIEVGTIPGKGETVVYVCDNGVGFEMEYADKLFGVFQRLHRSEEFEGTGIGLANVRRIIQRHGGRAWAEGTVDEGATFYFSLSA